MSKFVLNTELAARIRNVAFDVAKAARAFDKAETNLETAEAAARVALHEGIHDGTLAKPYALEFDTAIVAIILKYGSTDAGFAKAARVMALTDKKRTTEQQRAVKAARNRRTRLCKKLNVAAPTTAGRKRGTKMSPPASTAEDGPTLAQSKATGSKATAAPAVPILAAKADLTMWGEGQLATWKLAQKKGGKLFTHKWRAVIAAMETALADE